MDHRLPLEARWKARRWILALGILFCLLAVPIILTVAFVEEAVPLGFLVLLPGAGLVYLAKLFASPQIYTVRADDDGLSMPYAPGAPTVRWRDIQHVRTTLWGAVLLLDATGRVRLRLQEELAELTVLINLVLDRGSVPVPDMPIVLRSRRPRATNVLTILVFACLPVWAFLEQGLSITFWLALAIPVAIAFLDWRQAHLKIRALRLTSSELALTTPAREEVVPLKSVKSIRLARNLESDLTTHLVLHEGREIVLPVLDRNMIVTLYHALRVSIPAQPTPPRG